MLSKPPRKDAWEELTELIESIDLPDIEKRFMQRRWLHRVKMLDRKARRSKANYYTLRVITILGGVLVPALIGINTRQNNLANILNWVAFGLAQGVAVSAAVEELFRYGERYRRNHSAAEIMKIEGWHFLQLSGRYKNLPTHSEAYRDFAQRVESLILDDVRGYAAALRREQEQLDTLAAEAVKNVSGMQPALKERINEQSAIEAYAASETLSQEVQNERSVVVENTTTTIVDDDSTTVVENSKTIVAESATTTVAAESSTTNGIALPNNVPAVAPARAKLTIRTATAPGTYLKASPQQAGDLPEEQKHWLNNGTQLDLQSYEVVGSHYMFIPCTPIKGIVTWFVFADHVAIEPLGGLPPALPPVPPALPGIPSAPPPAPAQSSLYCGPKGKIPKCGVALIKEFEGFFENAYKDPRTGGLPITIGWGTTKKLDGSPWYMGEKITREEAEQLLYIQLEDSYLPPLEKIPCWNELNVNQKGAILSFAYNLGAYFYGNKDFGTMTRVLRDRSWNEIEKTFVMYRNPGTKVEQGLRRRREAEAKLFLTPVSGGAAAPPAMSLMAGNGVQPASAMTISSADAGSTLWVQEKLVSLCILDPPADGKWGKQSQAALAWFQKFKGLSQQSGDPTPETIEALKNTQELIPLTLGRDFASRIARFMTKKGFYLPRGDRRYSIVYVQNVDENFQLIRNAPDEWNDRRIILEVTNSGLPRIVIHWIATCDPGRHYTINPMNAGGAAQVAFGQYRAWQHGLHCGKYAALVQVGPIDIYRDANKNFERDGAIIKGSMNNGINQHHGGNADLIGRYSAGCLVGKNIKGHEDFMEYCKQDIRYLVNPGYTYWTTVIDGEELFKSEYDPT